MKRVFIIFAMVIMSLVTMAQTHQLTWANGRLMYGTSIETIDSLTYGEMEEIDTLHLLLPRTLIKVVYDTVYIHDTVYVECPETPNVPEDTHEYVDLGLSVKWATCNVGAESPEEYGDYFAWGEIAAKDTCSWVTYKYCNGTAKTLTKYCSKGDYGENGFTDDKTVLDSEDDVATANWGGVWRMPTEEEQRELVANCTWVWTTENGVNGYRVTSKVEGYTDRSIFLPAAGYRMMSVLLKAGSSGEYWSSSLYVGNPNFTYALEFSSGSKESKYLNRYLGKSVRPVRP